MTCAPVPQSAKTPGIWNPLPSFTDVTQDGQSANIQTLHELLRRRQERDAAGRLVDRPERQGLRAPDRARVTPARRT